MIPPIDLTAQRAVIEACLKHGVQFMWRSPGTVLVSRHGVADVIRELAATGFDLLGFEGFDFDPTIHPRLDLIFDPERRPGVDAISVALSWPAEAWIDLVIKKGS